MLIFGDSNVARYLMLAVGGVNVVWCLMLIFCDSNVAIFMYLMLAVGSVNEVSCLMFIFGDSNVARYLMILFGSVDEV